MGLLLMFDSRNRPDTAALLNIYRDSIAEKASRYTGISSGYDRLRMAEEGFLDYLNTVFFRVQSARYYVWAEDGIYTAALRVEPYKDGLLLSALETAPALRKHGYGKKLVDSLIYLLRGTESLPLYSHIRNSNTVSRHLHLICGFQKVSDYAVLLDGTVTSVYATYCVKK